MLVVIILTIIACYLLWLFIILFSSIFIYIYRLASNLALNYKDIFSYADFSTSGGIFVFFQNMFFGKGNIPNIPVLMKIIAIYLSMCARISR